MCTARRQKADKGRLCGIFRATFAPPLKDCIHAKSSSQLAVSHRTCADLIGRKGPPTKQKGPPKNGHKRKGPPTKWPIAKKPCLADGQGRTRVCRRNLVTATQPTNRSVGGPYRDKRRPRSSVCDRFPLAQNLQKVGRFLLDRGARRATIALSLLHRQPWPPSSAPPASRARGHLSKGFT